MIPGSGLPQNVADFLNTTIHGDVLVQIISITEIGHSAFTLQNVRQARLEREDMAGLARHEDDEEEGIPSYPRSMLRFQLSDGLTILQAIEFRHLEKIVLGETKLGYKVSIEPFVLAHTLLSCMNFAFFRAFDLSSSTVISQHPITSNSMNRHLVFTA